MSDQQQSIRIGGVPEHFNLPWHVGIESGDFAACGVEAEFIVYGGGTGAMMAAVANNEVDVAVVLTEGCIQSICQGTSAKIVKTFVQSPLIWGIHVPVDSDLKTVEDIRSRRYAISRFGSGSHLMAIVDAAERGWETDLDFEVVKNIDGARAALSAGDADVFFWERYTTSPYVDRGEFRRLDDRLTPWPAFVVCASDAALAEKSQPIKALLNQVNSICQRLAADGDQTQATIVDRYAITTEEVAQWWETTQWNTDWEIESASIVKAVKYLRRLELIDVEVAASDEQVMERVCGGF